MVPRKRRTGIPCDPEKRRDEVPDRTFEEAGRLAAYYSKNRGNEKAEIDYIEKSM